MTLVDLAPHRYREEAHHTNSRERERERRWEIEDRVGNSMPYHMGRWTLSYFSVGEAQRSHGQADKQGQG